MTKADGHEAQEAMYAESGKRYCERCGTELQEDEKYYLCKNCDLARVDEEANAEEA